jgi:hypothetical protein
VIAAADQEDAIFQVDRDAGDVTVLISGRKLFPTLDNLVSKPARVCHRHSPRPIVLVTASTDI